MTVERTFEDETDASRANRDAARTWKDEAQTDRARFTKKVRTERNKVMVKL